MNQSSFNPIHPEGFILSEPSRVASKLRRFKAAGAETISYLLDFDQTLTTSKHTGSNVTTWHILHGLLPEEGQRKSAAMRTKYLALEAAGILSAKDTRSWSASVLKLHGTHGTRLRDVEKAARKIQLRDGTRELFAACEAADIPTVILSAGVRDVIEIIADEHGLHPTVILSIKLLLSDDGWVIGWERGSMVHTMNKRATGNRELKRLRYKRPYTVLIGDTLEDAHMIDGDDEVLRIRICDVFKEDGTNAANYLQQSFAAGYDMVIEGSLQPIVQLTEWLQIKS